MAERSGARAMVPTPVSSLRASPVITSSALSALTYLPDRVFCDDESRRAFIQAHQQLPAARLRGAPAPRPVAPSRALPSRCTGPTPP